MSCSNSLKSCILLASIPYKIPKELLLQPPDVESDTSFMKYGFLKDSFKMAIFKPTNSSLVVEVYRQRENPREKQDDGYALRFYMTLVGSDEETKVAIMKHTEEMISTTFTLSENTLNKAKSQYYYFDLFVVVQMLEYKSLDSKNGLKALFDDLMTNLKNISKPDEVRSISYILKSPELEDTFTGRHTYQQMRYVFAIIGAMSKNFGMYAKYLKDRSEGVKSDVDIRGLLLFLGRISKERPLSQRSIITLYINSHKLGLEFLKTMTSDYLLEMIKTDCTFALDVLGVAVMTQDDDLIDEAIIPFLNNFHKIKDSARFDEFIRYKGALLRFIMHTVRIWVTNNDVTIPEWNKPALPTTEL